MSAEIFPWRREHLDLLRVLNDLDAVLDVRRDGVGVAGTQLVSRVACKHTDATRENIAGLLVRMRVKRDYVLFSVMHLGNHRLWPSGQEIEGNTKGISGLGFFRFDDVNHSFSLDERRSKDFKLRFAWKDEGCFGKIHLTGQRLHCL